MSTEQHTPGPDILQRFTCKQCGHTSTERIAQQYQADVEFVRLAKREWTLLSALKALVETLTLGDEDDRDGMKALAAARAAIALAEPPAESFAARYGKALEQDVMPY